MYMYIGMSQQGKERQWEHSAINFNWLGDAMVAIYVISSQSHWADLMRQGMHPYICVYMRVFLYRYICVYMRVFI